MHLWVYNWIICLGEFQAQLGVPTCDLMEFIIWTQAHQSLLATDDDLTLLAGAGPAHSPGQLGAELPGL